MTPCMTSPHVWEPWLSRKVRTEGGFVGTSAPPSEVGGNRITHELVPLSFFIPLFPVLAYRQGDPFAVTLEGMYF